MSLKEAADVLDKKIALGHIVFGAKAQYLCDEVFVRQLASMLRTGASSIEALTEENKMLRARAEAIEGMDISLFILNKLYRWARKRWPHGK